MAHQLDEQQQPQLFSWGSGSAGVLGHNDEEDYHRPRRLDDSTWTTLGCELEAGSTSEEDGSPVFCHGQSRESPHPGFATTDLDRLMSCSGTHTLLSGADRRGIWSFGSNASGESGADPQTTAPALLQPRYLPLYRLGPLALEARVRTVACGWHHSVLLTDQVAFSLVRACSACCCPNPLARGGSGIPPPLCPVTLDAHEAPFLGRQYLYDHPGRIIYLGTSQVGCPRTGSGSPRRSCFRQHPNPGHIRGEMAAPDHRGRRRFPSHRCPGRVLGGAS